MFGKRLIIGAIAMGIVVPTILFFTLGLTTFSQLFIVAVVCFLGWGVADLTADILARPRLEDRSPGRALRELDMQRGDEPPQS